MIEQDLTALKQFSRHISQNDDTLRPLKNSAISATKHHAQSLLFLIASSLIRHPPEILARGICHPLHRYQMMKRWRSEKKRKSGKEVNGALKQI
jgi:hypothetical protein